jgi:hypothetical protein
MEHATGHDFYSEQQMIVYYVTYRRTERAGGWTEGRMYSRVLPVECLLFVAQWTAGENPWQHPLTRLTPRHAI